ncbi:MAG: hypothetical protein ACI32N_03860 [Bulleidia sp.]
MNDMLSELLIVITGISLLASMCGPLAVSVDTEYHTFSTGYLLAQSDALVHSMRSEFVSENGQRVSFNAMGNVPYPRTIHFENHDIVIELGGGRLVHR